MEHRGSKAVIGFLAAACVMAPARAAAMGESLWKFFANFNVTVVEPIDSIAGSGSQHLLIGSQDDSLYLVETSGAGAGKQAWAAAFQSTLSSAAALPDLDG